MCILIISILFKQYVKHIIMMTINVQFPAVLTLWNKTLLPSYWSNIFILTMKQKYSWWKSCFLVSLLCKLVPRIVQLWILIIRIFFKQNVDHIIMIALKVHFPAILTLWLLLYKSTLDAMNISYYNLPSHQGGGRKGGQRAKGHAFPSRKHCLLLTNGPWRKLRRT